MTRSLEEIERYVLDDMTAEERSAFERALSNDQILQREVEKYRLIMDASELAVEDRLRKRLLELSNAQTPTRSVSFLTRRHLALAAGVAILLGMGIWLFGGGGASPQRYAAEHFLNYATVQLRSDNAQGLSEGAAYLESNQWREAATSFEKYLVQNSNDTEALFMLAESYYQLGRYSDAIQQYQKIINQQSTRWLERAQWNYACTAVAQGSRDLAMDMLNHILSDALHSYHESALELAKLLE